MALQVNHWEKLISGKSVPVYRPTEVLLGENKQVKDGETVFDLVFGNARNTGSENLKSCWHYFVKKYKCYFVKEQLVSNKVDCYFYHRFQFKKYRKHKEKVSGVFSLRNDKISNLTSRGFYYVSDSYGFAILHIDVWNKLMIYHCDIQTGSTKYAEISFKYKEFSNQIKLFKNVIWITRWRNGCCSIEAVIIKDQTWYHINSGITHPLDLEVVFSTDRFIGWIDGPDPLFSSCKMLYIDCDHLKSNEKSQLEFREFEKPNLQENKKNFKVFSVFNETVIVTDKFYTSCFLFISYKGYQIKLSRRIDASSCFQNHLQLSWIHPYDIYFLPGAARMAVRTDKNFIVIIDLRIFQITQMLTFRERFCLYFLKFNYSKYERALYLLGRTWDCLGLIGPERREFILKFGIWQGISLELCVIVIVNYFSVSEIKSFRLPQFLIEEILDNKLY